MPLIDSRTASQIVEQLESAGVPATGLGHALARVFARYCEIAIDRLNRAPDKNFLAYLDLLGNSLAPPQPASAPLTFSLTAGATREAVVPAGTQVAVPPGGAQPQPVIFETSRELVVAPITLVTALSRDAHNDQYSAFPAISNPAATTLVTAFRGNSVGFHAMYMQVADFEMSLELGCELYIDLKFAQAFTDDRTVAWEAWDGSEWVQCPVWENGNDETNGLQQDGQVVMVGIPKLPLITINGVSGQWIRVRWQTPISATGPRPAMIDQAHLPIFTDIQIAGGVPMNASAVIAGFTNQNPLDLTKDFMPLGHDPKVGDAFVLAGPVFRPGMSAQLPFMNSVGYNPTSTGAPQVVWEYWNGRSWIEVIPGDPNCGDNTGSFTASGTLPRVVILAMPADSKIATFNGVTSYWVRGRLVAGNYGSNVNIVDGVVQAPTLKPPMYQSFLVYDTVGDVGVTARPPALVLACNDYQYQSITAPYAPFQPLQTTSLSLGFTVAAGKAFPNKKISLYLAAEALAFGDTPDNASPAAPPRLLWEYWANDGGDNASWSPLVVRDETSALTRSGMLEFLAPSDFDLHPDADQQLYWIRARWTAGDYKFEPRIRYILPNTMMASQTSTLRNEILGSASGSQGQVLQVASKPVLPGQQLQVREPDIPASDELATLEAEEGSDAIQITGQQIWVRWHEVPDFYGSSSADRHYVLDHLTGKVSFGDGINGRVPPAGSSNIRLASYRIGGGGAGNVPAATITQLKTTVPYIDKVTNHEVAHGGSEAEDTASLLERAPRTVRHGGRAVTADDYEDLAKLASPEVARAKCVPLRDLSSANPKIVPGAVSLLVVPRSTDARPNLSIELIELVQDYVDAHRVLTADLTVTGAPFVRIDITTQISLTSIDDASDVETAVRAALATFLHPITGGLEGAGWEFGRKPQRADLYALLAAIPGVDRVSSLTVAPTEEPPGALASGFFLVYSGTHKVTLTFEG